MIPNYFRIIFVSVAVTFLGCQSQTVSEREVSLLGTWRLSSEEPIELSSENTFSEDATIANVINFFPDSSYTQFVDSGKMYFGQWQLSDERNSITFVTLGKSPKTYPLKLDFNKFGKQTFVFESKSLNRRFKFIKEFEPLSNFRKDPLYFDNNQWRLKPALSLDSKQIRDRVANYVKHYSLILKAAMERNQEVVSFEFSQGPIKIYNGAVGVYPFEIVPAHWKNFFNNESEAFKGYQIYQSAVEETNYRRASSGNWIEDDYHILNAIYSGISKQK